MEPTRSRRESRISVQPEAIDFDSSVQPEVTIDGQSQREREDHEAGATLDRVPAWGMVS